MASPRTLFAKLWDRHVVVEQPGLPTVLYIDLHLVHEVTSPQAFAGLAARRLKVRRPDLTLATVDHSIPTHDRSLPIADELAATQIRMLEKNCAEHGIPLTGMHSPNQGIVHVIGPELGIGGGTGHVFEYTGSAIRALSMEQRMTICNMSIEGGARAGMVAPDETTFSYVAGRPFAPKGQDWDRALADWRSLPSDEGVVYDKSVTLDAGALEPMITYGTNPGMGMPITGRIPDPARAADPASRQALDKALTYMDLRPGEPLVGQPVDVVFIGSCTNSRISDLRQAARMLAGGKVADGVRVLVVPGSQDVKRQAEVEGLAEVFRAAGAEWRESGCSMCIAMNGDELRPGQYAVSTSNRNFEGRQGAGGRTFLASPLTAAATALAGRITDPRTIVSATEGVSA